MVDHVTSQSASADAEVHTVRGWYLSEGSSATDLQTPRGLQIGSRTASWVSMMEQLYPCLASKCSSKCELQRCKAHRHWNPEKARRVHASSRSPMEESGLAVIRRLILV